MRHGERLPASRSRFTDYALVALVYLVARIPFVHTLGFPDGDASQIGLGIADALREGTGFHGVRLYGTAFTTGYYALFFALGPLHGGDPARLIPLMNGLGAAAGLAAQVAFYSLLSSLWGRGAALAGSLLLLFTPGWWELNTFGHPTPLAFALFLIALRLFVSRPPVSRAAAFVAYAAACLVRADLLLAGLAFPALAWVRSRDRREAALGLGVMIVAALSVALAVRGLVGGHGSGVAGQVGAVFDFHIRTVVKKCAVFISGAGPVIALTVIAGMGACFLSGTYAPLLVAAAVLVPEALWWLPVEGPFRQWLVAYGMALLPAAVWLGSRGPGGAVLAALALVAANQVVCSALYEPMVARYPWTYRAVPGERRWSTRAPIGDWFHHQEAAQRAVREEARDAKFVADYPGDSILVIAPAPYREEWEVLSRNPSYQYVTRLDNGALWVNLTAGGKRYLFLESEPDPTRRALARAYASGRLARLPVFLPTGTQPIELYPIPESLLVSEKP